MPAARHSFGGTEGELWCDGGESRFVGTHIAQSAAAPRAALWFSSLVASEASLPRLRAQLRAAGARSERAARGPSDERGRSSGAHITVHTSHGCDKTGGSVVRVST